MEFARVPPRTRYRRALRRHRRWQNEAAEAIANELRRDLTRVDLSAVVCKAIGETEKHLGQPFGAARTAAPSCFSTRPTPVRQPRRREGRSRRDASIAVADLLQRIEAYSGLAILAAKQQTCIDPAWARGCILW